MPRKAIATQEAVFRICDQIAAEGGTPGLREVRRRLGGGSFHTIGIQVERWTLRRTIAGEGKLKADGTWSALDACWAAQDGQRLGKLKKASLLSLLDKVMLEAAYAQIHSHEAGRSLRKERTIKNRLLGALKERG